MKRIGILLSVFFLISSCEDGYHTVDPATLSATGPKHFSDTLIKDSISGTSFYRLYRNAGFGTVFSFRLPDSIKSKFINIVYSGKARTNYGHSAAAICARTSDKDGKLLTWYSGNLRYHFTDVNTWCPFKDSMFIKLQGWMDPYYSLDVFSFLNGPTNEVLDLDSFQVQFKIKN